MKKYTFILSDNSLNASKTKVLTSGIDIARFKDNPIMLWMHQRDDGWEQSQLPIGRWDNIRIEDDKLLADAVFDTEDEFAMKIAGKVERKFISTCSIGINVIELSEDEELRDKGQQRPTISKCEIFEASIVDIPSNKNAIRLSFSENNIENKFNHIQKMETSKKTPDENAMIETLKKTFGFKTIAEKKAEEKETADLKLKAKIQELEAKNAELLKSQVVVDKIEEDVELTESEKLNARISELEAENASLKKGPGATTLKSGKSTDGNEDADKYAIELDSTLSVTEQFHQFKASMDK